jgi:hypothetical protein
VVHIIIWPPTLQKQQRETKYNNKFLTWFLQSACLVPVSYHHFVMSTNQSKVWKRRTKMPRFNKHLLLKKGKKVDMMLSLMKIEMIIITFYERLGCCFFQTLHIFLGSSNMSFSPFGWQLGFLLKFFRFTLFTCYLSFVYIICISLARHNSSPRRCKQYIPPKRRWIDIGLQSVMSY